MSLFKKEAKKIEAERDKMAAKVGYKIIAEVANYCTKLYHGTSRDGYVEFYDKLLGNIIQMFVQENVKLADLNYIFGTVEGVFGHLRDYTSETLKKHDAAVMKKIYGKDRYEITMQDIDNKLRELYSE